MSLALAEHQVDYLAVRAALKDGVDAASTSTLEQVVAAFHGPFLGGLDLPQSAELQSWIVATREEMRRLHGAVLTTLDDRYASNPEKAMPYSRELVQQRCSFRHVARRARERLAAARHALRDHRQHFDA